jgi:hypothetical protein
MAWTFPQIGQRFARTPNGVEASFGVGVKRTASGEVVLTRGTVGEDIVMTRLRTVIGALSAGLALGAAGVGCANAEAAHVDAQTSPTKGGTVRTAGGATATVTVTHGTAGCATVKHVLTRYYADLASGRAPGIGGGGPVKVGKWTCVSGPATSPGTTCKSGDVTAKATIAG